MLHIPILRNGTPYESVEKIELVHYATGEPVALVSQANSGLVSRDIHRMDRDVLESFTCDELMAMSRRAGELFMSADLPCGDASHSFDDYIRHLSATTGMPV
ncbi:MAG TPA: aldehyde dehydrogenase, partial [Phycisphaerae bacterium]|nr:aldehyde dehydrogenase [Phycisphaerae bacterium]